MRAIVLAAMLVFVGAMSYAQTPDGETPTQEGVCDSQIGAAFGLCNAYCEAMDCDSDSPNANARACTRVFDRFANITGQAPPCECSCILQPVWEGLFNGAYQPTDCTIVWFDPSGPSFPDYYQLWVFENQATAAVQTGGDDFGVCGSSEGVGLDRIFGPVEMGAACQALLEAFVEATLGLATCYVVDYRGQ